MFTTSLPPLDFPNFESFGEWGGWINTYQVNTEIALFSTSLFVLLVMN
jgi:hypothetical protein